MIILTTFLVLLLLVAIIVGLISPNLVFPNRWANQRTRSQVLAIYGTSLIVFFGLSMYLAVTDDTQNKMPNRKIASSSTVQQVKQKPRPAKRQEKPLPKRAQKSAGYKIALIAKPISNHQVEFNTRTNIPLSIEITASISLKNQKPEDSYIGYSKRVLLKKPEQVFVLDAINENLPTGKYIAEVAHCSNCPKQANLNEKLNAVDIITRLRNNPKTLKWIRGSSEIFLRGTGKSIKSVQERDKMQLWVMDNVFIGTSWNQKLFIEKLGNYQELKLDEDPGINPYIIKPRYFPKADMTIFVNTYRNEVTIWRTGKVSKL